jgi:hypothetical protein
MKSATIRSAADMESFEQWLAYYTETFARISDSALTGYWYMYGRDSEAPGTPRDEAAYVAVNAAMQERDI